MSERPVWKTPWPWLFLAGVVAITAIRPFLIRRPDPPRKLGEIGHFRLIDESGAPFGSAELEGSVYVASFFFTSCPSICPTLMNAVASLESRYTENGIEDIRLISITVDPERDDPATLRAYAERRNLPLERWTLLTGTPDAIRSVVLERFRTPLADPEEVAPGVFDIAHTGKLLLVDPAGGLRGYYDSDARGLDEIFHRSLHVRAEFRKKD